MTPRTETWQHDGVALARRGRGYRGGGAQVARALYLHPYTPESIWNITLRDGITYHGPGDPATDSYRVPNGNINIGSDWNLGVWYSHADDPLVPVVAASNTSTVYMHIRLPADWAIPGPLTGTRDNWVTVLSPDGRTATDFYKMTAVGGTSALPAYFTVTRAPANSDLTGAGLVMNTDGINTSTSTWGMRASALGYPGGSVRRDELLARSIRHAIAVAIPDGSLKSGYVWPARAQDSNAATAYAGDTPMGTRLALPPGDDPYLGLGSDEGRALADALLTRGAWVVDRASSAVVTCERPHDTGDQPYKDALGRLLPDWKILTKRLVRVTGHTPSLPGGPGAVRWSDVPPGTVVPIP